VFNVRAANRKLPSQWNQEHNACPPRLIVQPRKGDDTNKYEVTGFQCKCDHRVQTGCPCKLR
jgi:hypothetical protein